ncbi:serine/threonine-protein kinase [Chondromyces crocatus]|uniref:Protein kinase n=1 Tax=Chondromyces crocatus TaxID=52 RepID=A0A0K1ED08_CHOCO|nr:serine/threonine-protein kinase [Chondromyces crocatus]AKT38760.1 protein kinase [Chondromyces crocatus]
MTGHASPDLAAFRSAPGATPLPLLAGRYALHGEIARGGMASVHLGCLQGAAGFTRVVAIKRLHAQYAREPELVAMFTDEARLTSRIQHPSVVPTLDVVSEGGELLLVMEYVHGETLSRLIVAAHRAGKRLPPPVAAAIVHSALLGLHAAHEAKGSDGQPLHLVHRDVTPQNLLVGADGITRVADFGIAKAAGRLHTTRDGSIRGKLGYMPPEQLYGERLDRRVDVYAAGVVLWEALVGERLFAGEDDGPALAKVLTASVEPPGLRVPDVPPLLDEVVLRAVAREPASRFETTLEMARALEVALTMAPPGEVATWVHTLGGAPLEERAQEIARLQHQADTTSSAAGEASSIARTSALQEERPPSPSSASGASTPVQVSGGADASSSAMLWSRPTELAMPSASIAPHDATARPQPALASWSRHARLAVLLAGAALSACAATILVLRSGQPAPDLPAAFVATEAPPAASSAHSAAPPASTEAPTRGDATASLRSEGGPEVAAAAPLVPERGPELPPLSPPKAGAATGSVERATGVTPPTGSGSVKAASPRAAPMTTRPAVKADCNPPYTINEQGHKRYKRECLR